jgi:hypothetical protein
MSSDVQQRDLNFAGHRATGIAPAVNPTDVPQLSQVVAPVPFAVFSVAKGGSDVTGNGSEARPFLTVQKAVDVASLGAWTTYNGAVVLVHPGTYDEDVVLKRSDEDVVLKRSDVNLVGIGGQGVVKLKSLTVTNCTDASLAAFNASGDPTLLVKDVALPSHPKNIEIREIEIDRSVNAPAWIGDAIASLRCLGGATAGDDFLGNELLGWHTTTRQAAGAAAGKGGLYSAHANYVSFQDSWISGGCKTYQTAGLWFDFVTAVASPGGGSGTVETFYDPALIVPVDGGNHAYPVDTLIHHRR